MKGTSKHFYFYLLLLGILILAPLSVNSWGFFSHKRINRMAVFTLPPEMIAFYKNNIEYITAHAVDPDKRRYAVKEEAPRHFIDIDHFSEEGADPFEVMPRSWSKAVEKYTEDTLQAYGIVPWQINWMVYRLSEAFENGEVDRILSLSADLGHYVADAHVPLHTTENYNGQLTGQKGIHGFWESRLPELIADSYDYLVGRADYIDRPLDYAWEAVKESHSHLDSVLLIEKRLSKNFPADLKYSFERRGQSTVRQYSRAFSIKYYQLLDGMVEDRMRKAITAVGSLWYTAWVNAGQPDLTKMLTFKDVNKLQRRAEKLEKEYLSGNEKGRKHDKDD